MKILKYSDGASSRPHESYVIKNSETIFIDGPVKLVAGAIEPADAVDDPVYGLCKGFVGGNGNTPYENLLSGQKSASDVYTAGVSLAVHSNNQTVAKIKAVVEPVQPNDIIRGVFDADIGTSGPTGDALIGHYANVDTANESQFKQTTVSTSKEQFLVVGVPGTKKPRAVDVKLVEGQIFGQ